MSRCKPEIPPELQGLLLEFTVEVLLEKPSDLLDFAVDYFTRLRAKHKARHEDDIQPPPDSDESMLTDEDDEPMLGEIVIVIFFCSFLTHSAQ